MPGRFELSTGELLQFSPDFGEPLPRPRREQSPKVASDRVEPVLIATSAVTTYYAAGFHDHAGREMLPARLLCREEDRVQRYSPDELSRSQRDANPRRTFPLADRVTRFTRSDLDALA